MSVEREGKAMKLWLLRPLPDDLEDTPWDGRYDMVHGFVIRAETEARAREIATANGGDEIRDVKFGTEAWSAKWSSCVPLADAGDEGIVLTDFLSG